MPRRGELQPSQASRQAYIVHSTKESANAHRRNSAFGYRHERVEAGLHTQRSLDFTLTAIRLRVPSAVNHDRIVRRRLFPSLLGRCHNAASQYAVFRLEAVA